MEPEGSLPRYKNPPPVPILRQIFHCLGLPKNQFRPEANVSVSQQDHFYDELLEPHQTPKLEEHPPSAVRDCLFYIFPTTLDIGFQDMDRSQAYKAETSGTHYPAK
jgi:hypothetical protein